MTSETPAPDAADAPRSADAPVKRPRSPLSLEGRAVPGVYLIAWILVILGGGFLFVSFATNVAGVAGWLFLLGALFTGLGVVAGAGSQAIERSRQAGLPFHGPSPVLVFVGVVALTFVFLIAVLAPLSALGLDARSPLATLLNLVITAALYIGLVRMLVVGTGAFTWADMGITRLDGAGLRELLLGAALAVPVLVITLALGLVLGQVLEPAPSTLPAAADVAGLVVNLLAAALVAPLGEEIFFRGFATAAWARAVGPRSAIVRGTIFFGLAHVFTLFDASFAQGAQHALSAFLLLVPPGLALGWVYLRRGSIWAPIGLHAAFNAIQVILAATGILGGR